MFGKFWGGKGALGSGIGGRKASGDPGEPDGLEGMWGYVRNWFEKCSWVPCRILRVVMRVAQAVIDVYQIAASSWRTGMKWSALLEGRARWVAVFIWLCIVHVTVWMTAITIYSSVYYFGRTIVFILSCTPFASIWWMLQGMYWLINYKMICQRRVEKVEERKREERR